jgi:2-dehydro-3-deoxyphosphogluconate aldolase/(4S)-4-hydroxy-2-oxoglutarate aldolase
MTRNEIVQKIIELKVVAVIRMEDPNKLIKVAEAIYDGGVQAIEITMTVPNAIETIALASKEIGDKVLIGVGSILDAEMAQRAIDAGAQYVVSPIFKKEIIEKSHKNNIPAMPGTFSPTEVQLAYEAGADIVKLFPADVLGMAFIKGIKAPMPHLKIMPTGGVSLTNAGDWIKVGACAVGVGSALLDKKAIDSGNYKLLRENAEIIMNSIRSVNN